MKQNGNVAKNEYVSFSSNCKKHICYSIHFQAFDGSVGEYSVSLSEVVDVPFYAIRIVAVDEKEVAAAVTDEVTVGHAAEGLFLNINIYARDATEFFKDNHEVSYLREY